MNPRAYLGRTRATAYLAALLLILGLVAGGATHTAGAAVPVPTTGCGVTTASGQLVTQWRIPGGCDYIGYGWQTTNLSIAPANHYAAVFQSDGNLVVYTDCCGAVWASGTWGHPQARIMFQYDGNVVIYDGSTVLWAADPYFGAYGPMRLVMQDDGNLVLYNGNGYPYWSWRTGVCHQGGVSCAY